VDTLSKIKEKQSSPELLWSTEYAFVSLYSMDQCVTQLNALKAQYQKGRSFWKRGSNLSFEGLTDNGGVVQFEIKATASRQSIVVQLIGQLIYKDTNRTLVRLWIGVTRSSMIQDIIINIFIGFIFIFINQTVVAFVSIIFMIILIELITYFSFTYLRNELRQSVHEALFITKVPRPDTLPL
jgi:ABC-type multidrug transport system permease subunit